MEPLAAPCRQEEEGEDGSKQQEKDKEAAKKSESERDWTLLPQGPLFLISEQLQSEIDVVRFRSVCNSWRSATPRRQSPWFLGGTNDESDYQALFALTGARILDIPEIRLGKPCCSSCGWLADLLVTPLESRTFDDPITLFNPITMDHIDLPVVTGLEPIDYYRMRLILSSNPATTSDYIVAIFCDCKLAICRSGDKEWSVTPFPGLEERFYKSDVAFYRGLIYVAGANLIFVFDPAAEATLERSIPIPCMDGKSSERCCCRDLDPGEDNCRCLGVSSFLVESCGDLLLVRTNLNYWNNDTRGEVFKLQFCGVRLQGMVKTTESSLGDRALFIAQGCSFSLSATKFPEYKGNHIYFMGDRYIYVFSLADGKLSRTGLVETGVPV